MERGQKVHTTGIPEADALIHKILALYPGAENRDLAEELIVFTLRLLSDGAARGDMKILRSALKEIRHAFRVFTQYRGVRKVTIWGSARVEPGHACYELARDFARAMAQRGWMAITGAGSGIMQAGNEGAGRAMSFGINIQLPFEQQANPVIEGDPKNITFKYFFARKLIFVKESHALTLFPGGFGTLDEGLEALTLIQTGKAEMRPIIFLAPPGNPYWRNLEGFFAENLFRQGYLSPEDRSLFHIHDSVAAACDEIERYYRVFHSMRYVDGRLVLRLARELPDEEVAELNRDYADLLESGAIEKVGASHEEIDGGDHPELPRLALRFNRRDLGRLHDLIDRINRAK